MDSSVDDSEILLLLKLKYGPWSSGSSSPFCGRPGPTTSMTNVKDGSSIHMLFTEALGSENSAGYRQQLSRWCSRLLLFSNLNLTWILVVAVGGCCCCCCWLLLLLLLVVAVGCCCRLLPLLVLVVGAGCCYVGAVGCCCCRMSVLLLCCCCCWRCCCWLLVFHIVAVVAVIAAVAIDIAVVMLCCCSC